jgi:Xaa-Pro aminopeptidase
MDRRAEIEHKLRSVRAWLERHGLMAVLLGSQDWFAWITGGGRSHISIGEAGGVGSVLVTPDDAFLLTTNIELERLQDEEGAGDLPFTGVPRPWHEVVVDGDLVRDLVDPSKAVSDLGANGLASAPTDLMELRYTLLGPEIERYRILGADAAAAVEAACRATRPGDREHAVAARVAAEAVRRDVLPLVNLVAADDRIASYRHPLPTGTRVGRTMLVALTGRRHGLHASLTRMVSFGPPDPELAERHSAVIGVDAREILESRPGASLARVFEAGVAQYAAEGWDGQWRLHHQGGLTGYAGREIFATGATRHRLAPAQALAWNPSITRVKSEDTVLVTDDAPELLTRSGKWPERVIELDAGSVARPALLEA